MVEALREEASRLLEDGCDGIVGLRRKWGHVGPYLFTEVDELRDLVLEPRYPLAKLICQIQKRRPGMRLGGVVREEEQDHRGGGDPHQPREEGAWPAHGIRPPAPRRVDPLGDAGRVLPV